MIPLSLIDSHCHLDYEYPGKSAGDIVREAEKAGVAVLVTIGTELARLEPIQKISEEFPNVFHTVGVHPHDAQTIGEGDLEILRKYARHPKCRAIGEIGLDYHYDHSPRDVQIARLEEQLELALELNLPVVIHSREGEEDLLPRLQAYGKRVRHRPLGVIHCFTGTQSFGQACIDAGFYISFSGILTFKNADDLRTCAREFPLERLLVETDSPYLAPVPYRGKKCEPFMVVETAKKLAEIKGVDLATVAATTTENARTLFRLP